MTTERQAEILHVLQEKYGVLKGWKIRDDNTISNHLLDDQEEYRRISFNHGVVLDALWEWLLHTDNFAMLLVPHKDYIECAFMNLEKNGRQIFKYPLSLAIWHMAEFILQQKGELK